MKTPKRPVALMTVAQAICLLAVPVTLFFALTPAIMLYNYVEMANMHLLDSPMSYMLSTGLYCLRDLILGACLFCVEMEAIGVCGRVKKASAFSEKNVDALGRIVKALAIAGVLTLLFGDSLVPFLLQGLPAISPVVERLLLPFMLLVIALMIRAVQVLMRRALTMQEETDLTV